MKNPDINYYHIFEQIIHNSLVERVANEICEDIRRYSRYIDVTVYHKLFRFEPNPFYSFIARHIIHEETQMIFCVHKDGVVDYQDERVGKIVMEVLNRYHKTEIRKHKIENIIMEDL
jgi:hypothetical protein